MKKYIVLCVIIFLVGLGAGILLYQPFDHEVYGLPQPVIKSNDPVMKEEWSLTDVNKQIKVNSEKDIEQKRKELIDYIWKGEFPTRLPTHIEKNIQAPQIGITALITDVDRYEITQKGFTTNAYHIKTPNPQKKNKLIIFHHGDHLLTEKFAPIFINMATKIGFDILLLTSPLQEQKNNNESVLIADHPNFGNLGVTDQNVFFLIESENFSPLSLYLDPLALSLNFIEREYDYESYHLFGAYEGAWEATIYSAIDPRIKTSLAFYPPLPFFIATNSASVSLGNYENLHPKLYRIANPLTLFVMAGFGEGKAHRHIIDLANPRIYNEQGYQLYEKQVSERITKLGKGAYSTTQVDTTKDATETLVPLVEVFFSDVEGKKMNLERKRRP